MRADRTKEEVKQQKERRPRNRERSTEKDEVGDGSKRR